LQIKEADEELGEELEEESDGTDYQEEEEDFDDEDEDDGMALSDLFPAVVLGVPSSVCDIVLKALLEACTCL